MSGLKLRGASTTKEMAVEMQMYEKIRAQLNEWINDSMNRWINESVNQ